MNKHDNDFFKFCAASYFQTLAVAQDLRLPIYTSAVCRCLETEHIVGLMSRVQWDIKEVMSQHSHYIDVLLQV